jgi:hypothetical protein
MVCQFENGMVWYDVPWKLAQFFYFSSGLKRSQENLPYHFSILGLSSDPVTSEAGARRPRSISNLYLTPWHVGPTWLRYVVQYHVARVLPTWGCALRVATERGAKSIFSNTHVFYLVPRSVRVVTERGAESVYNCYPRSIYHILTATLSGYFLLTNGKYPDNFCLLFCCRDISCWAILSGYFLLGVSGQVRSPCKP